MQAAILHVAGLVDLKEVTCIRDLVESTENFWSCVLKLAQSLKH